MTAGPLDSVDHPKLVTPERKRELTDRGPQIVTRVTCPACHRSGRGNVQYYSRYAAKTWIHYYRCLNCRMRNTGKPFTFAVEILQPKRA